MRKMTERDSPGVIAPPPLIALAAVVIGFGLDWLFPAFMLTVLLSFTARIVIGFVLAVVGVTFMAGGIITFSRSETNVDPYKPAIALVTTGIFAYMRNPMYVGWALLVVGIGIALASDWTVVMVAPMMLIIHFGVVRREEHYLETKFSESYRRYKAQVPRYGWPGSVN
jgi:protein-S-isoprenylcysteine O-methyltransferase Ste14